jgi:arylsulfatase A-like enzyme
MLGSLASCGEPGPPPHILLVTADTLRADHLSFHGYPRATSPRIDAFAEQAHAFTQAFSVIPKTAPSFATMFTGRQPEEHGVRSNFARLPQELPVLAERLREAGYRTAAFVSNPALREAKGFGRGFDRYRMFPEEDGVARVNRAFLDFAQEPWERPSFVWLHYIDPHGPYEPPARYEALFFGDAASHSDTRVPRGYALEEGRPNKVLGAVPRYQQRPDREDRVAAYVARYDAEIRYVDDAFGEVTDTLRARDLYDASAIVFTSDHGESLGEHDLYFEHGWFAYDASLRVPFFVKEPGQREGRRVDTPVSNLDLLPTLLGLARVPLDAPQGIDLLNQTRRPGPVLVQSSDRYPEKFHGARSARWKYLRRQADGREELYDLEADPGETNDLAASQPRKRRQLGEFVVSRLAELRSRAVPPAQGVSDDPETLERLRELGYVQ